MSRYTGLTVVEPVFHTLMMAAPLMLIFTMPLTLLMVPTRYDPVTNGLARISNTEVLALKISISVPTASPEAMVICCVPVVDGLYTTILFACVASKVSVSVVTSTNARYVGGMLARIASASLILMGMEVPPVRIMAVRYEVPTSGVIPNVMVLSFVNVGIPVLAATLWMALTLVLSQRMYTVPVALVTNVLLVILWSVGAVYPPRMTLLSVAVPLTLATACVAMASESLSLSATEVPLEVRIMAVKYEVPVSGVTPNVMVLLSVNVGIVEFGPTLWMALKAVAPHRMYTNPAQLVMNVLPTILWSTGALYPPRMTLLSVAVPLTLATACVAMASASLSLRAMEVPPVRIMAVKYEVPVSGVMPNVMVLSLVNVGIPVLGPTLWMALKAVAPHRMNTNPVLLVMNVLKVMLWSVGAVYPPRMTLLSVAVPVNFATTCVAMASASLILMGMEVPPVRIMAVKYEVPVSGVMPNVMVLSLVNVGIPVLAATLWMALMLVLSHRMYTVPL